jgi:hypothetical protein
MNYQADRRILFFGDVFVLVLGQTIEHNNTVRRVKQLPTEVADRHLQHLKKPLAWTDSKQK